LNVKSTYKQEIIALLKSTIHGEHEIYLGYLFGSFIQNNEFHDIDVGIVVKNKNHISNALKYSLHLGTKLEKAVNYKWTIDVKILNFTPPHFQFGVIKDGLLFFCRNEKFRITYEKTITNLYLDFRETLLWHSRIILERT